MIHADAIMDFTECQACGHAGWTRGGVSPARLFHSVGSTITRVSRRTPTPSPHACAH